MGPTFTTVTLLATKFLTVRGSDFEPVNFERYRDSVIAFEEYGEKAISSWEGSRG
ncbi:hypothetical protein NHL50_08610 [Acidimicrobiia bacterium EGI L10123]|uniref:hypothetical protein n=1 Tax=Salinilacustrithrix flava TaxID=2957203 RepID=UPI003D7C271B|nr:hypothetical protein [Acidimicrobiia bacterium EGI L10123]